MRAGDSRWRGVCLWRGRRAAQHIARLRQDALVASHASEPALALEIAAVLPGSYEASLLYLPTDDERAAGQQEEQSAPLPITVQAKQRTEIQLEL